jgi:5'-3' exonuclease
LFELGKYKRAVQEEIGTDDAIKTSMDLTFISFFIGNDFIKPIAFTQSNKRGQEAILNLYRRMYKKHKKYLVEIRNGKPVVNSTMFIDFMQQLSNMEDSRMKKYYNNILEEIEKEPGEFKKEITLKDRLSSFEHGKYYLPYIQGDPRKKTLALPDNPFYEKDLHKAINYNEHKSEWNKQYYSYYFGISPDNPREYKNYKRTICKKYLESLAFTLQYYLVGVPSWQWYYPFRVAPMPSDIMYYMRDMPSDLDITFEKGEPYAPIEQLTMILPLANIDLLPKSIQKIITNVKSPLVPYFPIDFQIDKLFGEKFIYSKPLIPSFEDDLVRPVIQDTFSKFTKSEKERNKIETYKHYKK